MLMFLMMKANPPYFPYFKLFFSVDTDSQRGISNFTLSSWKFPLFPFSAENSLWLFDTARLLFPSFYNFAHVKESPSPGESKPETGFMDQM